MSRTYLSRRKDASDDVYVMFRRTATPTRSERLVITPSENLRRRMEDDQVVLDDAFLPKDFGCRDFQCSRAG